MNQFLCWLEVHPALGTWAQAIAILITGICAIAAGFFGFRGAKAQADVLRETYLADQIQKKEAEEKKLKSITGSLSAELKVKVNNIALICREAESLYSYANENFITVNDCPNNPLEIVKGAYKWIEQKIADLESIVRITPPSGQFFDYDPSIITNFDQEISGKILSVYGEYQLVLQKILLIIRDRKIKNTTHKQAGRDVVEACQEFISQAEKVRTHLNKLSGNDSTDTFD